LCRNDKALKGTEEHSSEESIRMKDELHEQEEQLCFERVTVKEEPSFEESVQIKQEMSCHIKEEPELEDEQPLMSPGEDESTSDVYSVEKQDGHVYSVEKQDEQEEEVNGGKNLHHR
jgi:hypothetical protein